IPMSDGTSALKRFSKAGDENITDSVTSKRERSKMRSHWISDDSIPPSLKSEMWNSTAVRRGTDVLDAGLAGCAWAASTAVSGVSMSGFSIRSPPDPGDVMGQGDMLT